MADVNKTAIFTLEIDNASFNREIVDATKQIQDLTHEKKLYLEKQKLGIQLTDEEIIAMKKLDAAIAANKKVVADNTKILQKQTEASLAQAGSQKQLMAQYEAASLELKRLGGSFTKATDGTLKLTGSNKELAAETNAVFQRLKEYDAALGKHNLNVGNYGGVLTQLKQKIQELDQQRSIATDPDEVLRLTSEMRKATFEMDKMTGKVDAMGNRVAKNDIKDGFQDATSAVGALGGALSLLSLTMGGNEEASAKLQKVIVALTLSGAALNIIKNKQDILDAVALVKTKLLTAAQWAYNAAVKASTKAQTALNATLVGAAVTGVIIAITKIVDAMKKQRNATQEAIDKQEEWKQQQAELTEKEVARLLELEEKIIRVTDRMKNIRVGEAQGKDMTAARISLIEDEIKALDNLIAFENKRSDKYKQVSEIIFEKKIELMQLETAEKEKRDQNNKSIDDQSTAVTELATAVDLLTEAQKRELNFKMQGLGGMGGTLLGTSEEIAGRARSTQEQARQQMLLNGELEKEAQLRQETLDLIDKQRQAYEMMSDVIGNVFSGMLATAEDQQKEFYKNALLGLLDYLEKFLTVKIAETFINEVSSKSFAGVITASILTGLMKAALNGVRGSISGYAEGGLIEDAHGVPIQRSNGDNRLVTVKTGEVVMNENQQAALKQQAGVDIFKRLRVPGFATGGLVLGDGGLQSRAMVSKVNNSFEIRQMVVEAMRSMPHPIVEVTEINAKQAGYRRAEVMSGLQS